MPVVGKRKLGRVFLGVDPGASGGMACIECMEDGRVLSLRAMTFSNVSPHGWMDWIVEQTRCDDDNLWPNVWIEKVGGFTGEGQPGSAMFNFGKSAGLIEGIVLSAKLSYELVPPQTWQKKLAIPKRSKKETRTQWKNRLKAKAQQLFPDVKITLATADAILIAEACRREHTRK